MSIQLILGDCLEKMKEIPDGTVDMVTPKSVNGELSVENMRFVSWFENRAKADISLDIWNKMKDNLFWYL